MSYITGFLLPVPAARKEAYLESARKSWPLFQKYDALEQVETWGEDIPPGKVTGFDLAVKLEPEEVVVFSWLRWPDRTAADKCFAAMMDDPDFANMDMPFDGKRMMWGGFAPIFEGK
jgi:uncharacterized protein YbaA (DUF1428 family)